MTLNAHALISLEERFAEGILNGTKLVELRRRSMRLEPGTTVWFYVKVPVGQVIGSARVHSTHALAPSTLWRRYGDVSGLSRAEFFDYFAGVDRAFALVLNQPKRLEIGVSLQALRKLNGSFQPPQFFQHLAEESPLVDAFLGGTLGGDRRSLARRQGIAGTVPVCA
jgi:predicted transcriptional regulator